MSYIYIPVCRQTFNQKNAWLYRKLNKSFLIKILIIFADINGNYFKIYGIIEKKRQKNEIINYAISTSNKLILVFNINQIEIIVETQAGFTLSHI